MNAWDTLLESLPKVKLRILEPDNHKLQDFIQKVDTCIKVFEDSRRDYEATGRLPNASTFEELKLLTEERAAAAETIKEHVEPSSEERSSRQTRTRQTRTRQTRSRCPAILTETTNIDSGVAPNGRAGVVIKKEKISICNSKDKSTTIAEAIEETAELNIKKEKEDMPAPLKLPPRQKKKRETKTVKTERNSDVIIQNQTITVVNLVDGSDEERKPEENVRQTRARTKRKAKRSRTPGSDVESKNEKKRSKSNEQEKGPKEEPSSPLKENIINTTYVASTTEPPAMNATIVVQNPVCVKNGFPQSVNDMMTDDESEEELVEKNKTSIKTSTAYTGAVTKVTKPIFNPFEQSPVKTKVQAFEKLCEESNLPVRTNRTITRSKQKNEENVDEFVKSNVKEKAKIFTPAMTRFLPASQSTSVKSARHISVLNDTGTLRTAKTASGLKASLEEFREKAKRKQEKEMEANKKREAMLQFQTEEKKRKREEKQLKAQQQREAIEKEKLKVLEAQRLKDERHRQVLAEQEEKKNKQKEEAEKKRMMAKLKAREEKKREEKRQLEERQQTVEKKQEVDVDRLMQKKNVKYLCSKTPLLPTPDCYDSDDERYQRDLIPPAWTNDVKLSYLEATKVGEAMKNRYFSIQAQTPDLEDIFTMIAPEKLKRSSSAVWHKPPRCTMVPVLENHDETEEFDYSD